MVCVCVITCVSAEVSVYVYMYDNVWCADILVYSWLVYHTNSVFPWTVALTLTLTHTQTHMRTLLPPVGNHSTLTIVSQLACAHSRNQPPIKQKTQTKTPTKTHIQTVVIARLTSNLILTKRRRHSNTSQYQLYSSLSSLAFLLVLSLITFTIDVALMSNQIQRVTVTEEWKDICWNEITSISIHHHASHLKTTCASHDTNCAGFEDDIRHTSRHPYKHTYLHPKMHT